MHVVIAYVIAALLAAAGMYGVVVRRNAVLLLMSVELILAAATLIFVTADTVHGGTVHGDTGPTGQVFALFVIVLAAAEIGVGLAIVLRLYRSFSTIDLTEVDRADPDPHREPV
ncbi:MAG: NADH-quinone oxidoreductase subunit NuoK [Mycobacteriales bacterium]